MYENKSSYEESAVEQMSFTTLGIFLAVGLAQTQQLWAASLDRTGNVDVNDAKVELNVGKVEQRVLSMGEIQDVVTCLAFDPWNQSKADLLKISLESASSDDPKGPANVALVMDQLKRLSKFRTRAENGETDLFSRVEQGHDRVLNLILTCFDVD